MESITNQNIDSENPPCLVFSDADAYIIGESNQNKYPVFALTKKNKQILGIYRKLWNEIKNHIKTINRGESIEYNQFMKIRFDSNDDLLSLSKILSIPILGMVVKSIEN